MGVVVSAMGHSTDFLIDAADSACKGDITSALSKVDQLLGEALNNVCNLKGEFLGDHRI